MKIPNAERSFIDIRKLRDYALDTDHRIGKHKARIFAALLGMGMKDASALREILLKAIEEQEAVVGKNDKYGQRYEIEFLLNWYGKEAIILSAWIIRPDEDFPRLVTCYPLEEVA